MSQLLPRGAEGVELDRTVALRERALRRVAELGGRALHRVPAVRVGGDPLAYRSPEEPIHGLTERLSHDVPARHLDHREGGHCDLPCAGVVVADHAAREGLDRERIGADDMCRHGFFEIAEERAGVVDHANLADAADSLVGADDDEREVAPRRAEHERPDLRDLHPLSPVVTIPRTMKRCANAKKRMSGT